jgi:soluble lytic murein transglycosylase
VNQHVVRGIAALCFGLLLGAPAPDTEAARRGPPEGSSAWLRGQRLLARPAPALASAVEATKRVDRLRAEWLLAEISLRHPLVRDYADWMRARLMVEAARPEDAATVARMALEAAPDSSLRGELLTVEGDALAQLADEDGAQAAWRAALDATRDSSRRAGLLLSTAASQERAGQRTEAIETYRVLWHLYPLSEEAARAGTRLDGFQGQFGEPLRTADDWRRRADSLFRARRNAGALEAYEKALSMRLSKSQKARARHRRAQTLFRMRRYPEAVQAFAALPQKDDTPIWHARSLARADRVPEAIAAFEKIAQKRRGTHALRARFLAALLLDGRGETKRSREYLESLTRDRVTSSVRRASLWRLGWRAYRERRYADAIRHIDQLIVEESDPIGGLRSRYWRARALERLGADPSSLDANATIASRQAFEEIARNYPLTYYGWRARLRVPHSRRMPQVPAVSSGPLLPGMGERKLSDDQLERVRILLEAGLEEHALDELSSASKQVGGLADRLELAQLYRSAGSYRAAQRLVLDPYKEELARGPSATLEELWWHAWPAAFLDLVEEATQSPGSVDSALVFSIMREESGFRPRVVSPVGARGLLQIMEPTGERLALAVGHPDFDADDLFEPRTNIRLGSFYLGELSERFDGRLSAAIASYNAGPEAVAGWLDARPELDDDEWIEAIPYEQTRSYVKRVLRSLQAYRLLY